MPTQEERLTTLEQAIAASQKFQQQAAAHIRETEENTILLGVIRSQGQDIKRIVQHIETIDERLETMGENIVQLKTIGENVDQLKNDPERTHNVTYPNSRTFTVNGPESPRHSCGGVSAKTP
jgi:small-conductance mechanosensitive channel